MNAFNIRQIWKHYRDSAALVPSLSDKPECLSLIARHETLWNRSAVF
jgi:hypothetical protein